jgi:DNA polymerase III subunit alpha
MAHTSNHDHPNNDQWWHAHTHSQFSALDGMSKVERLVEKADWHGQPALGLMDHGNMAGTVRLYRECKKRDMLAFPGTEAYLITHGAGDEESKTPRRFHVGLLALDLYGYQALVDYVSRTHTRPRFSRFPRMPLTDLAALGDVAGKHIALLTGCYFGLTQQRLVESGAEAARSVIQMYAKWFPHTFVEVQNHNIVHDHNDEWDVDILKDEDITNVLVGLADELGLPIMATQDAHYCDSEERYAHKLMKRMVYGSSEDEFPGDSFHLASTEWVSEHHLPHVWDKAVEGAAHLLSLNRLVIPPLDKFKVQVPKVSDKPMAELRQRCKQALNRMDLDDPTEYQERLEYEFDVIKHLGMASYFVLCAQVTDECRRKGYCVEVRGSGNGSLVAYLLDITSVDPIEWGLTTVSFDRFLSKDRIKPPDIDIDIEDIARGPMAEYVFKRYDALHIGTWSMLGVNDEGGGSVLRTYQTHVANKAVEEASEAGRDVKAAKSKAYAMSADIEAVRRNYSKEDAEDLQAISDMQSVYKSYGVHAGGFALAGEDMRIGDYVPTMLVASSNTIVTQFNDKDVEAMGLLKLDLLGQRTLTIMRRCQELMGRDDPLDFKWIPLDDKAATKILREGRTDNGIFHFEAYTKSKGGKSMGIKSVRDAILAQALFMPGAMETGQTDLFLQRRKDKSLTYTLPHPIYHQALDMTHGAVVFQDQPMLILKTMGMTVERINVLLSVVKDSGRGAYERNQERLDSLYEEFSELCEAHGIDDVDDAWHYIIGFMSYGFNEAHATGYGIRAYRCAYLKAHYPLAFMSALLESNAGSDKEQPYVREARRIGIRILPPHVNESGMTWTMIEKKNAIRRGLVSLKGVGEAAAQELADNAPYESVSDIIERCTARIVTGGKTFPKTEDPADLNGVLGILRDANALEGIL